MKKWTYLIGGIVIGAIVSTAGNAFADQVKSLVGKKVTGEYEVVVNGKALQDKGAVIEGRTNVPVRGITQALGADFKVEGKKIVVTTGQDGPTSTNGSSTSKLTSDNEYMGDSKKTLEELKYSLENRRLAPLYKERESILKEIEMLKKIQAEKPDLDSSALEAKEKQLTEYDEMIAEDTEELRLVNEALAALEK